MNTFNLKQKRALIILISLFTLAVLFIGAVGQNAVRRYTNQYQENLLAQIEVAEADALLEAHVREIIVICLTAVGGVAAALFVVWRELYLRGYHQQIQMALALHEAESRWQFALEGSGDGVWDWNTTTNKVFYSRHWKAILGFADDEIGDALDEWQSRVHPDDLPLVMAQIEQHFAGQTPLYVSEHRLRAKDGSYKWILDRGKVIAWDENHTPLRAIGTHTDITAHKLAASLITAQRDLARIISTATSQSEVWSLCLNTALKVAGMDSGGIYLFDEANQALELVYQQGLSEAFVQANARFPADSPQVQGIRHGHTIYWDVREMKQHELYRAEGLSAAAIIPIQHHGKTFGCVNVASHTLNDIPEHTRHALETIALEIGNIVVYLKAGAMLRASEEKYRSLINSQDATIATVDANGVFHYINQIGSNCLNALPEDIIGQRLHDFLPPENAAWQLAQVQQVIQTGQGVVADCQTVLNDQTRWRHVSIQPVHNGSGKVTLAMVNSVDITAQKQMEYDLQEAEDRLLEAQELAHMGSWEWDFQKETLKWSAGVYRIFGVDPAHFTPSVETFENAIHPEDKEAFLQQRTEMLAEKQFAVIDHRIILSDGQIRYVQERTRLILDETGNISRVIGIVQDITEAKTTEATLRASDERYRLIAEYVDDIVWQLDTTLHFVYVSPAAERVLGYSPQEAYGFPVTTLLDETGIAPMQTTIQARLTNSIAPGRPTEYKMRHKDGHWVDVEVLSSPIFDNQGQLFGFVGVTRDITARKQAEMALHDNEERLRLSLQAANQGLYDLNVQTGATIVNPQYALMLGYDPDQFVESNQAWINRLHPDDQAKTAQVYRDYVAGRLPEYRVEFRQQTKQGDWKWILSMGKLVEYDAEGQPLRMVGTHTDITERKQAEAALRASEEQYRGLMESLDSVVATVDESGQFLYMNDRAAAQLNGIPADFVGKTMHDLFPEPVATRQLESIRRAIREDKGVVSEAQTFVQGEYRWNRTMIQPIHDETGHVVYALINATDIHHLKQIQQELQELNRTLEERVLERTAEVSDLYNHAPNGYHSVDKTGLFVMINQTELDWLGYTHEEIVGHTLFRDLITSASRQLYFETFPRFKKEGAVKDIEFEMVRKDGSILPVLLNAIAVYDEQGQFSHSRSTIVDITERRKALQALRESRDELRIANDLLEKAAQMKDEFLANMSHELRTPLNAILTFSESLLEEIPGPLNDRQKLWIQNIESSGSHLLSLINDILDLSKVEAGHMELQLESGAVADVCQASLLFVKQIALKKNLKLEYRLDSQLAQVEMDQKRLKQMLVNLLTNAVKFTPSGGKVGLHVTVDSEAGVIRYVVVDTGIGIAAADLERLFQPFTQLDSRLNRQHDGTGLGLALVRRLAELHGGSVIVESELGVGSRFTISLPYQPGDKGMARRAAARHTTSPLLPPSNPSSPIAHILLAEDNEFNVTAMADYLKSRNYQVTIAHDGLEAIALAQLTHPDLILMDIQMPEVDGLEAIQRLRTHPDFATTPIIALTALAMPGDRERCLAAGANEYLTKPVSLGTLRTMIQAMLP